jgi:hypothetical protein
MKLGGSLGNVPQKKKKIYKNSIGLYLGETTIVSIQDGDQVLRRPGVDSFMTWPTD